MFSKKATEIDKIFTVNLPLKYLVSVKSTVKILSIFVAFLENMNFKYVVSNLANSNYCHSNTIFWKLFYSALTK